MVSRPKQAEPRPAPRFYLITPPLTDGGSFAADLSDVMAAADVAAVLLRLADGDERSLINRVKAGELVNYVATQVGGKGGGRPDMAQAGGTDSKALPKALASVQEWVEQRL